MNIDKIIIGKILAPHGVRGEVRIKPLTEIPERFLELEALELEGYATLKVEHARFHKHFVLVKFTGVDDMNQAEKLRNLSVIVAKDQLGKLPEGRYYAFEIEGLPVYDLKGDLLGKIVEIIQTGSNDVYVVKNSVGKEIMIPALKKVVREINLQEQKVIVDLLEWE